MKMVVVTGLGPICSLGIGKKEVLTSLFNQESKPIKKKYYYHNSFLGEFYKYVAPSFNIDDIEVDKNILNEIKVWKGGDEIIDFYYLLYAIKLALDDSGIKSKHRKEMGVVLAHENIGVEQFCLRILDQQLKDRLGCKKNTKSIFQKFYNLNSRRGYELQSFMTLFHIAKVFNIHGYSLFVNNACSSGLYALEAAINTILSGRNHSVIVAAADVQEIFKLLWVKEMGLYSESGTIRPFDVKRDGFICGDGASAILLEEYGHAIERNAHIYAYCSGSGFTLESWKITVPDICHWHYSEAIKESLVRSGISCGDIDLISAHGTGTRINDLYESEAIRKVFRGDAARIPVCAFKSYVGHSLGSSALLETILSLFAMENGRVPKILGTTEIDQKCNLNLVLENQEIQINNLLKISCGFGGYNAAMIFRKGKKR